MVDGDMEGLQIVYTDLYIDCCACYVSSEKQHTIQTCYKRLLLMTRIWLGLSIKQKQYIDSECILLKEEK